jgi:hypothetical protein
MGPRPYWITLIFLSVIGTLRFCFGHFFEYEAGNHPQ